MVIPLNGGGGSALSWLEQELRNAADWVYSLGTYFFNIPVLGPTASDICNWVGYYIDMAASRVAYFAWWWSLLIDAIVAIQDGTDFSEILSLVWPQWEYISSNPLQWLLNILSWENSDIYNWYFTPISWIVDRFEDAFPMAWLLFNNPQDWLYQTLSDLSPFLWGIYTDGIGYIIEVIYQLYPETRWVFDDPLEWLQLQLHRMTDIPWEWLTDPTGNLLELVLQQLENSVQESKDSLLRVGEKVLRYLWEGV